MLTSVYADSVVLTGGIDLLASPDANRIAIRLFSFDSSAAQVGPPESFLGVYAWQTLPTRSPVDLLYSKLGPFVQGAFYVKGFPGARVNAISVDI